MKVYVEVPEVHKNLIEVDVPDGSDLETINSAAQEKLEDGDEVITEYSHTLEDDEWIVRDGNGNHFGSKFFGLKN